MKEKLTNIFVEDGLAYSQAETLAEQIVSLGKDLTFINCWKEENYYECQQIIYEAQRFNNDWHSYARF